MNEAGTTEAGAEGFFNVVRSQRACRQFTAELVPEQLIDRVLTAATHAPSAENTQPWVFIVVTDPATRRAIGEVTRKAWRSGGRSHSEGRLAPSLLAEVDQGAEGGISAAPVLIVIAGDRSAAVESSLPASIFPAAQNLLLAANAVGLGSALTTLTTMYGAELSELVGLPDTVRPMAVVPLGWPSRPLGPPRRQPIAAKTHRERYGNPWRA